MQYRKSRFLSAFHDTYGLAGLRIRSWYNDNPEGDYDRDINQSFLHFGVGGEVFQKKAYTVSFEVVAGLLLDGTTISKMSQTGTGEQDITHSQKSGSGFVISIPNRFFVKNTAVSLDLKYQNWSIADSDYTPSPGGGYWIEPKNTWQLYGMDLSVQF